MGAVMSNGLRTNRLHDLSAAITASGPYKERSPQQHPLGTRGYCCCGDSFAAPMEGSFSCHVARRHRGVTPRQAEAIGVDLLGIGAHRIGGA